MDGDEAPCRQDCGRALGSTLVAAFNLNGNLEALHTGAGPAPYFGSGFSVDASAIKVHGSGAYAIRGAADTSRIEVPGLSAITDELTWMAWVRVAGELQQAPGVYPRIVDQWSVYGSKRGCALSVGARPQGPGPAAPGEPFFECFGDDGGQYSAIANLDIRDDAWHHWAGVWGTDAIRFYIDGTERAALTLAPGTHVIPNADVLMLGGSNRSEVQWESLAGYLDEVYFFNAALSPAAISDLAANPLTAADLD